MRIYLRLLVAFLLLSAGNVVYAEAQQEKRVTGTVTSEGEPLPGVSVQVKGASSGTITDIDGNYSIEAPANGTIVFRFVGLRTVEQPECDQCHHGIGEQRTGRSDGCSLCYRQKI